MKKNSAPIKFSPDLLKRKIGRFDRLIVYLFSTYSERLCGELLRSIENDDHFLELIFLKNRFGINAFEAALINKDEEFCLRLIELIIIKNDIIPSDELIVKNSKFSANPRADTLQPVSILGLAFKYQTESVCLILIDACKPSAIYQSFMANPEQLSLLLKRQSPKVVLHIFNRLTPYLGKLFNSTFFFTVLLSERPNTNFFNIIKLLADNKVTLDKKILTSSIKKKLISVCLDQSVSSHPFILDYLLDALNLDQAFSRSLMNAYYEGEGELPLDHPKFRSWLIKQSDTAPLRDTQAQELKRKFVGEDDSSDEVTQLLSMTPEERFETILHHGVKSWETYRLLRKMGCFKTHEALNPLKQYDCVLSGFEEIDLSYSDEFLRVPMDHRSQYRKDTSQEAYGAYKAILNQNGLVKIISSANWTFFFSNLRSTQNRCSLRELGRRGGFKYSNRHHQIHPHTFFYNDVASEYFARERVETKKTSTTLISPLLNTPLFGHQHKESEMVGLLFSASECRLKNFFVRDTGTFKHYWVGSYDQAQAYMNYLYRKRPDGYHNRKTPSVSSFKAQTYGSARLNEVLANVSPQAILAILIAKDTPQSRQIALERQQILFEEFGKIFPIMFYDHKKQSLSFLPSYRVLHHKINPTRSNKAPAPANQTKPGF